nr:MAG TPA: hypothetical protein [Caudoviricetes sp.]
MLTFAENGILSCIHADFHLQHMPNFLFVNFLYLLANP